MTVFVCSSRRPAEGRFQGEGVDELELLPHDHSAGRLLLFLNLEVTIIKVEEIGVLVEKQREDPLLQAVCALVRAPVHEQVLAPGVAMDVAVEQDVSTF